jgi:subtilisin-like proprotein convertase family protein
MKKLLQLLVLAILIATNGFAQGSLWQKTSVERISGLPLMDRASMPLKYQLYSLELSALKNQLQSAPLDSSGQNSNVILSFPNPDGGFDRYAFYESPIMEQGLADQFPDIKTYSAFGIDDRTASMRISITEFGLHSMTLSGTSSSVFIDTYTKDLNNFIVYRKSDINASRIFQCEFNGDSNKTIDAITKNIMSLQKTNDSTLRTYRLAVACTGEYAQFHGGTVASAQAAIVTTVNRVNLVYLRDLAVRLVLVANNTSIIYTDGTTDPFDNSNTNNALLGQSQTVITNMIGSANFDIGHTVSTGGGGVAGLGVVCINSQKARGITGSPAPVGDPFDIDYVAHEMGHQFGCNHTQNNNCQRNGATAVEPGSGSTIMAYAGICPPNVQNNSDSHFSFISLAEAQAVLQGTTCALSTANGNFAPVVNAGANFVIPFGTAFILKGNATDANSDTLTYCWEQTNNQASTQPPVATSATGPNFRSLAPSSSPNRFMPVFSSVLAGNLAPTWEVVSNVARVMNFTLTVRDNSVPLGGQTNFGNMTVTTAAVGPFRITGPATDNANWPLGSSQTITWDVAGTTANGINTANVNILISRDGGTTFTTLVANTPNDGTETITVAGPSTQNARIMIEAVGNIFYALSRNINIGFLCNTASESPNAAIADGLGANSPGAITTRTLTVPTNSPINNMRVNFVTAHSWIGDLVLKLKHPDGTEVTLWSRTCNNPGYSGMNVIFADGSPAPVCASPTNGTYSSFQPLSVFNGKPSNGVWTLTAQDFYNGDTGSISSWNVDFGCSLDASSTSLTNFSVYPNPNKGNFTVQFSNSENQDVQVTVFDIRGRIILENNYLGQANFNEEIQLNNAEKGVYLVKVSNGKWTEVKKVIVE